MRVRMRVRVRAYMCVKKITNFQNHENEKKIVNWILRRGEFQDVTFAVDYRTCLANHIDFARFNALLCEIRSSNSESDDELRQLVVALLNSPFWAYDDALLASTANEVVAKMADRMYVEVQLHRHVTLIANHYKHRRHRYSAEKVILEQMLASLADFGMQMAYERHYCLVAFLLLKELREWVVDISVFESEQISEPTTSSLSALRLSVQRSLVYLDRPQRGGRIISPNEYALLINEIVELLTTEQLPNVIVPLALRPNGALLSGFSYTFVTYGINLIYRRNSLPRNIWIEYLFKKICRPKATIDRKFSRIPDTWRDKIVDN